MLTRGTVEHAYRPSPYATTVANGVIKQTVTRGVTQTWAIARPVSAPYDGMAHPMNVVENQQQNGEFIRGGALGLSPNRPRLMMDPTNPGTWQRAYRFDH